ncbi:MAG TPA: ACP S-malonyltransferase [Acidimicrobiales bacterium]|nr:ACP S-malonyltransferase [Acidimicrobiales bacterium]
MRAFLFPGQGTQRVGMGQQLCHVYPAAAEVFDRAGDVLGFDIGRICREGPAEQLTNTRYAQPAVFTCSAATLAAVAERGIEPDLVAGHSVGEFTALMAAGALSFEDALLAVQQRAELMAEVTRPGTMTAVVGLDPAVVEGLCVDLSTGDTGAGRVVIGLHNGDRYVVLSGDVDAVRLAETAARAAGALKILPLAVSHAFHSPLMAEVAGRWAQCARALDLRTPDVPVALNTTGHLSTDVDEIRQAVVDQVTSPVQWVSCVRALLARGMTEAIEVGDSKVLATIGRNVDRTVPHLSLAGPRAIDQLVSGGRRAAWASSAQEVADAVR